MNQENKKIVFNFHNGSNLYPMMIKLFSNVGIPEFLNDGEKKDFIAETNAFKENESIYRQVKQFMKFRYNEYEILLSEDNPNYDGDILDVYVSYLYPGEETKKTDRFSVFMALEEIPLSGYEVEDYEDVLNTKNILITCSNNTQIFKNTKFLYKLAFIHYFYHLGYYHLDFDIIKTEKINLLGAYHRGEYKPARDKIFNLINKIIPVKKYGKYEYDVASVYNMKYAEGWYKNHIIYYYDYIKSVCNIIFESDIPFIDENRTDNHVDVPEQTYHITEKTVKAVLFSNFEIFFIYVATPDLLIKLYNDGFWFLNFEFIDFKLLQNETNLNQMILVEKSVTDSVNYLKELNANYTTLSDTHEYLVEKYGHKLKNNYKLFNEILTSKELSSEVIDFILESYTNRDIKNTPKIPLI